MRIIRVFPRRTNATPTDPLAIVDRTPGFFDEADEVHISVAFTWDLPKAEWLAKQWSVVAPVKIGGPATGMGGGEFTPEMYVKNGYVITSRGCPNQCWFCDAWKREGNDVRELKINDGWNVLDSNILACSEGHIRRVFAMLSRQKEPIQFTGGLEAKRLKPWIAEELRRLRVKQVFFAYDTPDDLDPLRYAGEVMQSAGFNSNPLRCYVLCGYKGDTFDKALSRMKDTIEAGFLPMAMLYRGKNGKRDARWSRFQRQWVRLAIIKSHEYWKNKHHEVTP